MTDQNHENVIIEVVRTEEKTKLAANADDFLKAAQAMEVASWEDHAKADTLAADGQKRKKEIEAVFDPLCKKAHEAHRALTSEKNGAIKPIEEGRKKLKEKMAAFEREQERIRKEQERKAEQERQERERAERERLENERLEAAQKLESEGHHEAAQAVLNADYTPPAQDTAPAPISPPMPKRATTIQYRWTYEIIDEGVIPRQYLTPDTKKIQGMVNTHKQDAQSLIPGIRVKQVAV